ncbi:MAG: HAD family hydrolase [Betaproteobacteria bacterium HGW-Betaproteobacteria-3]|jgi:putative hydrolase of the HAD superfamily|nr:MAG: HAD family hydrolase [Betaproteobacteria bacterium HGW-Betaproteobacteria-3]
MLNVARIRAISIDLDDTLWPIWPTIERAERVLHAWLQAHAPQTAALSAVPGTLREVRDHMNIHRADLAHDLSALRRESIRTLLVRAGDDPALAEPAFEAFFAERQRVEFFDDALPALAFLASRFPVVALSNGNADVHRVGIGQHFTAALSARELGLAKPDPRMFHAGAKALGVPPQDVLHVGDDAQLDVAGGLSAGMQVAWINRPGHAWHPELHRHGQPQLDCRSLAELCDRLRG